MSWRCVRVRRRLALYVGGDLCERDQLVVQQHLLKCSSCRAHSDKLALSHDALLQCRNPEAAVTCDGSLWPAIQCRMAQSGQRGHGARSWLPIAAMIAATLTIGVVVWNRPTYSVGARSGPELHEPAWDGPDWTASLTSPASLPADSMVGPERPVPKRAHFQLEGATPVVLTPGDF